MISSGNFLGNCVMIGRVGVTCISANVFFVIRSSFSGFQGFAQFMYPGVKIGIQPVAMAPHLCCHPSN